MRESNDVESKNKYVDSGSIVLNIERIGLLPSGTYLKDITAIAIDQKYSIQIRKKAFYQNCLIADQLDFSILNSFSLQERMQIQAEMKQWKNSSDHRKIKFITNLGENIKNFSSASDVEWITGFNIDLNVVFVKVIGRNNYHVGILLAKSGAVDINAQFGSYKRTALMEVILNIKHSSIYPDVLEFAQYLLSRPDLDLYLRDQDGKNVLTYAVESNNFELVQTIFSRMHFDPDKKIEELNKLYILSTRRKCNQICDFFKEKIGSLSHAVANKAFIEAVSFSRYEYALEIAKNNQIDINAQFGSYKRTALMEVILNIKHSSIYPDVLEFAQYLLSRPDLDLYLRDQDGKTALDYAVSSRNTDLINQIQNLMGTN